MHEPWSRPWDGRADTVRMQALARGRLVADWPRIRIHPGDLDWWAVQAVGSPLGVGDRARLWFEGPAGSEADLLGFAWYGPPAELDLITATRLPAATLDAILGWAIAWAQERQATFIDGPAGPLAAWAAAGDPEAAALRTLGWAPRAAPGFVCLTGDLSHVPGWPQMELPAGLEIRPLAEPDIASRVACGRAAFPGSTMTVERYRTALQAGLYRSDLDLLVVEPAGRVVAFALGWLDPETATVELEPVGVHPDWQGRGLGREICRATLRAARDRGANRAVIEAEPTNLAATALYSGLGLTVTTEIHAHARPSLAQPG